eukprot:9183650-Alexandrium_andersonii.AAC.1
MAVRKDATACAREPGVLAVAKAESRQPRPYRWSTGVSTRVSRPGKSTGLSASGPGGTDGLPATGGPPTAAPAAGGGVCPSAR